MNTIRKVRESQELRDERWSIVLQDVDYPTALELEMMQEEWKAMEADASRLVATSRKLEKEEHIVRNFFVATKGTRTGN